jgi:hypothetical protein
LRQLRGSRETVTRAMNDMPGISPATRERVQQLAAELGYTQPFCERPGAGRPDLPGAGHPGPYQSLLSRFRFERGGRSHTARLECGGG